MPPTAARMPPTAAWCLHLLRCLSQVRMNRNRTSALINVFHKSLFVFGEKLLMSFVTIHELNFYICMAELILECLRALLWFNPIFAMQGQKYRTK
jgi:hypothetical protein